MTNDWIAMIVMTQVVGMVFVVFAQSEEELPWKSWETSRETDAFLTLLAYVFAGPLFLLLILGLLTYGLWRVGRIAFRGPVALVRDVRRKVGEQKPREVPMPDPLLADAEQEIERLLTERSAAA
jgi:hypothetical protein